MGINISVRKIKEKRMTKTWSGTDVLYYTTEEQGWFDSFRHSGDREFARENEFFFVDQDANENELMRPTDFDKTRSWIKANVIESNQKRLLDALDKMQQDEELVFTFSY